MHFATQTEARRYSCGKFHSPLPTCVRPLLSYGGLVSNRSGAVLNCVIAVRKWGGATSKLRYSAKNLRHRCSELRHRSSEPQHRSSEVGGGTSEVAPPHFGGGNPHFGSGGGERPFRTWESLEKVGSSTAHWRLARCKMRDPGSSPSLLPPRLWH